MEREKYSRPMGAGAPHYPNKNEGKALRQLMAKSGNSKEEVLADKSNRRVIAEAQKAGTKGDKERRQAYKIKQIKRWIASKLGVPMYDPAVLEQFNYEYEVCFGRIRRRHGYGWIR
jgi:hypothetical protein